MTSSQTTQPGATTEAQPLTAPAGLNLLGDTDAGGCCGADGCCSL
ncbi:hypothetical protein AB0269_02320 [Microbacterium sp. NPDC077644]|nr:MULTISPECIES: hypothetical protein [Microbacterium]